MVRIDYQGDCARLYAKQPQYQIGAGRRHNPDFFQALPGNAAGLLPPGSAPEKSIEVSPHRQAQKEPEAFIQEILR